MLEAEIAFVETLDPLLDLCSQLLAQSATSLLASSDIDLEMCWNTASQQAKGGVESSQWTFKDFKEWVEGGCPIARVTFTDAMAILGVVKEDSKDFRDLTRADECQLTRHFKGPVFVTHWPAHLKAFYMRRQRSGSDDSIVECFDLIVPNVGELIGGSLREDDLARLERNGGSRVTKWYSDLRRYGSAPHGGFGLGTDRLVQFLTGSQSIQDISFLPRSYKHCPF